jgi:hypothetical protein
MIIPIEDDYDIDGEDELDKRVNLSGPFCKPNIYSRPDPATYPGYGCTASGHYDTSPWLGYTVPYMQFGLHYRCLLSLEED